MDKRVGDITYYIGCLKTVYDKIVADQFLQNEPSKKDYANFKQTLNTIDQSFRAMEKRIFDKPSPNQISFLSEDEES